MARQNRIFKFNTIIHVMNRFNPEISLETEDIDGIRQLLIKSKKKFNVTILNYSIINNHFHQFKFYLILIKQLLMQLRDGVLVDQLFLLKM